MVKGAKDGYGAARKTESEKKAELRAVQEKLKAAFTVLEEMGAKRDEEGGGVNALYEEKKALHEEVSYIYTCSTCSTYIRRCICACADDPLCRGVGRCYYAKPDLRAHGSPYVADFRNLVLKLVFC